MATKPSKYRNPSLPWVVEPAPPLPPFIRIGPYDVKINQVSEIKHGEKDCWGLFDAGVISIVKSHPTPAHEVTTFIHEAIHAVWDNALVGDFADEETAVHVIATGLVQIFRDNRWLLKYIEGHL